MNKATIKKSAALLLGVVLLAGFSVDIQAQEKPSLGDEFIFFINGANVQIPILDGTSAPDPLDPTSGNVVYRIPFGTWAESGFRWNEGDEATGGVDASAFTGDSYTDTDTLFVKFLSDSANIGRSAYLAFFDTRTGIDYTQDDLPFRMLWTIPTEMHNGEWQELAIPLPPATNAGLDSAKAGVDINGDSLTVEVDPLFEHWDYPGAWANPGIGGNTAGDFIGKGVDGYQDFQWNAITKFGIFWDTGETGAPIYFDYYSFGVPPSQLVDEAPSAVANVSIAAGDGENTITWSEETGVGGYNVYFSESEITNTTADGVTRIGSFAADAETKEVVHALTAPHPTLADGFTAHYAVTATSLFGTESAPTSNSAASQLNVIPSYGVELGLDAVDAVFAAIEDKEIPESSVMAGFFPEGYTPFTLNAETKVIENGEGGDGDDDISGKFWIGTDTEDDLLIIYTEVTDDSLGLATTTTGSTGAWNFDSWEMGLANYEPASFIAGSTHEDFQGGDEPDYQMRAGMWADSAASFIHMNGSVEGFDGEVPNSETIGEKTDTGYRLLTIVSTIEFALGDDVPFDFATGDEINLYPFNVCLNDNDDTARNTQICWSKKGGDDTWWNTPAKWTVVSFVGADAAYSVSNEVEDGTNKPEAFTLEQNYPNPFNPTTNIQFTLGSNTEVTLEVFNMLGQKVATLLQNQKMTAGQHTQAFNASNLASGMYVYRISTPSFVQSRKMMLIK